MKNYIQKGDNITVAAPEPLVSGQGIKIGALFGVASTNAAVGEMVALSCRGVFALPKDGAVALVVGDAVEWDGGNAQIAALTTGEAIGVVVEPAAANAPSAAVRLV